MISLSRALKIKALAALTLFTFIVMLFVSNDSPVGGSVNQHVDSAIFFMSGKAWANGLIPYVDFSDSKGPLLWFIEMVGYLISPTDYHGVWLLSWVVMSLTFYVCWLTAMAVLHRPKLSLCVATSMALIYFLGFSFLETRAETWCNLPVAYGIYLVVSLIVRRRNGAAVCLSLWQSGLLGVSVMSCVLIKWSVGAMMLSLCLAVLVLCWRSGMRLVKAVCAFLVGAACLALPFVVYLATVDAFMPFLQEYFLGTAATSGVGQFGDMAGFYLNQARRIYHSPFSVVALLLAVPGSYMLFRKDGWVKWILPLCACVFIAIGSYRNLWLYYLQSSLSFSVLGLIWMAHIARYIKYKGGIKSTASYFLAMLVLVIYTYRISSVYKIENYQDVITMDNVIIKSMTKNENTPKVLCYRAMDVGVGIGSRSIPANKYWTFQTGATQEMIKDQDDAVRQRKADIVYTLSYNHHTFLTANGYMTIYESKDSLANGRVRIYVKK